jgi:translation elongation factor EF-4
LTYKNPSYQTERVEELNIWDTSGNLCHRHIVGRYLANLDLALLVTDSFSSVAVGSINSWFMAVMRAAKDFDRPDFVIVKTKSDVDGLGAQTARETMQHNFEVVRVSAKTGEGMEALVARLFQICDERSKRPQQQAVNLAGDLQVEEAVCKCI